MLSTGLAVAGCDGLAALAAELLEELLLDELLEERLTGVCEDVDGAFVADSLLALAAGAFVALCSFLAEVDELLLWLGVLRRTDELLPTELPRELVEVLREAVEELREAVEELRELVELLRLCEELLLDDEVLFDELAEDPLRLTCANESTGAATALAESSAAIASL